MKEKKRCFVIMPFGEKKAADGTAIDFDEVYEYLIKKAVTEADLDCIRCDEIERPGWIHSEMINHVYESDVAVVDVTALNPNVFYELGVRHALRPSVTVLIIRKGTETPFNIQGLNLIEYDPASLGSVEKAKEKISEFIRGGMRSSNPDSLVHNILDLQIGSTPTAAPPAKRCYPITKADGKSICIITGDIQNARNIDIWVNSENTNMQMARFYDRSISSVIRFLGAEKDDAGHVTVDTIANELAEKMGAYKTVNPATIIATSAGQLASTHGVKRIFHAAAVTGAIGRGYVPIDGIEECVSNALRKADSAPYNGEGLTTILFPLMGTGTAGGDLRNIIGRLLDAALDYLCGTPDSTIDRAYFIAWSQAQVVACHSHLDQSPAVGEPFEP